jgi:hypothetical protein
LWCFRREEELARDTYIGEGKKIRKRMDGRKRMGKKKRMQHWDFPGGHPSQYYSGPKALNWRVLMGPGVVALVWPHHGRVGAEVIFRVCRT